MDGETVVEHLCMFSRWLSVHGSQILSYLVELSQVSFISYGPCVDLPGSQLVTGSSMLRHRTT
jgi:hypothetical protein